MTVTVLIGNSDDKLTQEQYSNYWVTVMARLSVYGKMHFEGASRPTGPYQNAAWVLECKESELPVIKRHLTQIRKGFRQDSIAFVVGTTEFI